MIKKSKIVTIEKFHAKKLNNDRNIYVYLPESYETEKDKRYPVLYMHDGQYAFKKSENTNGSWNAHLVADKLIAEGKIKEIIIVAVPNMGSERGSEYAHGDVPFVKELKLEAKGLLYEDFLINDLKPFIDKNFRALTDSADTALLGSSMGGLVTYNIGFRNPDVFGCLGMMSPAFFTLDTETFELTKNYCDYDGRLPLKIWTDIGEYENLMLERHVRNFVNDMIKKGFEQGKNLYYYSVPDAAHFEADWYNRLHDPLIYFFGNVGNPKSAKLAGGRAVGLKGMKAKINTVVKYDSGFTMSDINGKYITDDESILEVLNDGTIIPKKEGKTKVTYVSNGIEASGVYTVVKDLSEFVNVRVNVKAPEDTPDDKPVTLNGWELEKAGNGRYTANLKVPRNCGITYKIARGSAFPNPSFEQDKNHKDIPFRRFKASDDMTVNVTVESWKDLT